MRIFFSRKFYLVKILRLAVILFFTVNIVTSCGGDNSATPDGSDDTTATWEQSNWDETVWN